MAKTDYVDGFVLAVPAANKDKFIAHAEMFRAKLKDYGVLEYRECWGDDVPEGETTSFTMAVKRKEDEAIVFAWLVWPDKETRDGAMQKMMEDPDMSPEKNPMPFDGKRMIFGGFRPVVEL